MVVRRFRIVLVLLMLALVPPAYSSSDDGSNPSESSALSTDVEELLREARELFILSHPIDARSRLLRAIEIAPSDYRPYLWLGRYYLSEVGHFQLAYRYIRQSETLFEKQFGNDRDNSLQQAAWREHASLLYLRSEAELNLDMYSEALATLDRFARRYWDDWYPGARAWVLMKLKRVDEAITVAQAGILRGAEPGRTYNILGILLSLKDSRELALDAFGMAIKSEFLLAGSGQVATPLNNAGEVYRELFQDEMAESAWVQAVQLPDGCDHILPSLNLAILYIDQLRLLQAERVLSDFQACYANHALREDSEHRALLALARGRIALHKGDVNAALENLTQAMERQQWFGKIGTNENDVRFAATVAMAEALTAKAAVLRERASYSITDRLQSIAEVPWLRMRAWWLNRRAREIALKELDDFEDLYIRNTDTMIEYPTLGSALQGFPEHPFKVRTERISNKDHRDAAKMYYQLYVAENLLAQGSSDEALKIFKNLRGQFRQIDRLAQAEVLVGTIQSDAATQGFFSWPSLERKRQIAELSQELFELLPSHLRYNEIALPVFLAEPKNKLANKIAEFLTSERFSVADSNLGNTIRYELSITAEPIDSELHQITIALLERQTGKVVQSVNGQIKDETAPITGLVDQFITKTFSHDTDPSGQSLPKLKILEGVM